MKIVDRLSEWKKTKKVYDFSEFASEIKNCFFSKYCDYSKSKKENYDVDLMINDVIRDFELTSRNIKLLNEESVYELKNSIFICVDTQKIEVLYKFSPESYLSLYEKMIFYFLSLFAKIDILVSYYGEKSIYFNKLEDLVGDFSFYENYILQIENLIECVENDIHLTSEQKKYFIGKLIPVEIINMDYLFAINKLFENGKFTSYAINDDLREMYFFRFEELVNIYQNLINLKIIPFPVAKHTVEIKIKQMNIKNKYNISVEEKILPQL